MYLPKTPEIAKKIFPKLTWDNHQSDNSVYLSFDDGPTPEITDWVLDQLERYDAKATFFCLGKNVVLYPEIFERIRNNGHTVGNHTYNHLNCWQTDKKRYLLDIESCSRVFHSKFFRPPYGKLKPGVRSAIRKDYEIVMWDIMAYDFDQSVSPEDCARNVIEHVHPGSIIVFHDSLKAEKNLRKALPAVLEDFKRRGLQMKAL